MMNQNDDSSKKSTSQAKADGAVRSLTARPMEAVGNLLNYP